jgi:hypothetical protein
MQAAALAVVQLSIDPRSQRHTSIRHVHFIIILLLLCVFLSNSFIMLMETYSKAAKHLKLWK